MALLVDDVDDLPSGSAPADSNQAGGALFCRIITSLLAENDFLAVMDVFTYDLLEHVGSKFSFLIFKLTLDLLRQLWIVFLRQRFF